MSDERTRFSNVVLPHLGDAYALARWLTGDRADAEDVVQDACLRAFRAIGGFAGNSRAFNFANLAAESISAVEVYKTPDASLIGQGLAGGLQSEVLDRGRYQLAV